MALSLNPGNDLNKPRQAAATVVNAVCEHKESLDIALAQHGASLKTTETGLFQEIAYGGVRWYLAYLTYINTQLKKPFKPKDRLLNAVLVTALYQLDYTQQAPHAVVNEAVNLAGTFKRKWAAGVINAVLRAYLRSREQQALNAQANWYIQSFPVWLHQQIKTQWPDDSDKILQASQARPPMTLRVNTQHQSVEAYLKTLKTADIEAIPCADSPVGVTLLKPVNVDKLPGFATGRVSVQDESAQLATLLLDLSAGQTVLDACAAPGGKSMHILETEPALDQLTVLDFPNRMARLRDNFKRAQLDANIVEGDLRSPDEWWDKQPFDRILLDAPCTGTGIIRRHPDIKFRRQAEDTQQFAAQQQHLLQSALEMLKPGGKLLYTTCSISAVENEQLISGFINHNSNQVVHLFYVFRIQFVC